LESTPRARVLARATQDQQAGVNIWQRLNWPKWAWPSIAMIWLAGAVASLAVCIARILSFQRLLRFSVPGPRQMQERVDVLAKRVGMRTGPRVVLVSGLVCPMVWPAGKRAVVLVPSALWGRLDNHQRDTLLLHELAHLRRRDHWVRWFELIVTVLYWWNPICWWARHELREAEEQCCDAWVLWALPGSFKQYASALLEAVEFVSVRPSAPLLASGMGQFGDLRRRLTMLKQGEVARALSWSGLAAACGAGALLLSIAPTLAQSTEKTDKPTESAPVPVTAAPPASPQTDGKDNNSAAPQPGEQPGNNALPAAAPTPVAPVRVGELAPTAPVALPPPAPANVAPIGVEQGESDVVDDDDSGDSNKDFNFRRDMQQQKANQQWQQADAQRQQGDQQRQQADTQRQQADQQRQLADAKRAQARAQSDLERARRDVEMLSKRLAEAADRLKKLEMQNDIAAKFPPTQFDVETRDGKIVTVTPRGQQGGPGMQFRADSGGYSVMGGGPAAKGGSGYPMFVKPSPKGGTSSDDRERRLEAVERELSELLKEVRQLRDDKDGAPRTPPPVAR
jgi:beta-lactamase regulating signal transducer with metallopeptidase domain